MLVNSGRHDGLDYDGAFAAIARTLRRPRPRAPTGALPPARLGRLAGSATGARPIPVIYCDACGMLPVPEEDLPVVLPEEVSFEGVTSPLTRMREFYETQLPAVRRQGAARDRHLRHLRRVVLVLPALLLPGDATMRCWTSARDYWMPGRPVHRRRRARDPAPPVRALLPEAAARRRAVERRRALHEPAHAGHGAQGRRQDVQVEGQHGRPAAHGRALRRGHGTPLHDLELRRPIRRSSGSRKACKARSASSSASGKPCTSTWPPAPPTALDASRLDDAQRDLRRLVHQTIAKVSDDVGRRYTFNTAIAAIMELMNALGRFEDASPQGRAVMQEALEAIVLMLAPMTPHVSHVLWRELGHARGGHRRALAAPRSRRARAAQRRDRRAGERQAARTRVRRGRRDARGDRARCAR